MAKFIVKLEENKYVQWSTVTDSPETNVLTKDEILEFMKTHDRTGENVAERFKRVETQGTSSTLGHSADDLLSCNRAGPDEVTLSKQELIELYTFTPDKADKFPFR